MNFDGRIAIVTGAGGGLGRLHALALAKRGAKLIVNDLGDSIAGEAGRSIDRAQAVVDEIRALGGEAIANGASVTDVDAVQSMVDQAMAKWGRIDILVNNAGVLRDKTFANMTLEDFRFVVDVHLMGAVNCTKAVWQIMRDQKYGRIIMTSSASGLYGNFGQANYGAAKMALIGLMQTLALEGDKYGIRVNALAPVATTRMTEDLLFGEAGEALAPELISPGLVFLASEEAPQRTVLAAGAGCFERANVTLTKGIYIGDSDDIAVTLAGRFADVCDRTDEIVPENAAVQTAVELTKVPGFDLTILEASKSALTSPQSPTVSTEQNSPSWPAMSFAETHKILTAPGSRYELTDVTVRGVRLKTWKQVPPTLYDVFVTTRSHGDATFLVYEEERISFEAFARAAIAFAGELRTRGVTKGDRVAIAMRNLPEWPVAFYGAMLCGAIVTPMNGWWLGAELEYGLRDCGAKVLVADAERYDRLRDHLSACPDLNHVFVTRATSPLPQGVTALESVIGRSADWASLPNEKTPDIELTPEDEVCILFTSGTTGNPKGALMTHRNIMSSFPSGSFGAARNALRHKGALPAPRDRGIALLLSVPFFHANGAFIQLVPAMLYGGKMVLMHKWNAERAMQLIERERITHAGGVPTVAQELATHPERDRYDLSSLELIGWGGASSPPELVAMVQKRFPGVSATNAWGMTETSGGVTQHAGLDYEALPNSAGLALPIWDVKVTDADGNTLPADEVGELWAKGPGVIKGYWNRPEDTAETFIDGWVRTGDIGRIDKDGFLFIVDRKKDMLIRGGENIYCVEIENAFYEHPDVIDAAIVPIPHPTLGEVPGAILHLRPGATTSGEELRSFVAARLAAFKVPVEVLLQPEPLPRNQTGKIMKRELRSLFSPIGSA